MNGDWAPDRIRHNFRLDLLAGFCAGAYMSVVIAFMPIVVRRAGGSSFEVALVVAAPFIGHLLSPAFTYFLASVTPTRFIGGTVIAARAIFIIGMIAAATPLVLALSTVVLWILTVSNIAAYTALMAVMYPKTQRAQAMSRVRIVISIAGIVAAALAGVFIDLVPATLVFALVAFVALPGGFAYFAMRLDKPAVTPARRSALTMARDLWADRRNRRLLGAFFIFGTGNLSNSAVIPILLVDHYNAPSAFIGAYAVLQSSAMIITFLFLGRLLGRASSLRYTLYNSAIVMLVPLGYIFAPSVWALLPVAVIFGACLACGELTFFLNIVQLAPPGRVAEYAAANSFLLGVRGTAAPFLASILLGIVSPQLVLALGVTVMLAGLILMARAVLALEQGEPTAELAPA